LPFENEDHMPPAGKPQPQPEDIAVLRRWIDAGAPSEAAAREPRLPADIR